MLELTVNSSEDLIKIMFQRNGRATDGLEGNEKVKNQKGPVGTL